MMNAGLIAAIGAAVVLLTTSSSKIKGFIVSLQRFWLEKIVLDKELSGAVFCYCVETKSLSRWRAKTYFGCKAMVKGSDAQDDGVERTLAMDILSQSTVLFWDGWKPIITSPGKWVCNPTTSYYERTTDLYLPRFVWNANDFLKTAIDYFDTVTKGTKGRFNITNFHGKNKTAPTITMDDTKRSDYKPNPLQEARLGRAKLVHMNLSDLQDLTLESPFDWYAFSPEIMESVNHVRWWYKSRHWYQRKRIPWRRGWAVYGLPGSGKTLLLKCLAQDIDLPVFSFDLPSMSNEEFVNFWSEAMSHAPCMILFEDFDTVFHGREAMANKDLTFDCILNCISGVGQVDGFFLGITANEIKHIDAAMGINDTNGNSSRPGRIDEVIQLGKMDEACRRKTAINILDTEDVDEIVHQGDGMTAAQFVELCNKLVLSKQIINQQCVSGRNGNGRYNFACKHIATSTE